MKEALLVFIICSVLGFVGIGYSSSYGVTHQDLMGPPTPPPWAKGFAWPVYGLECLFENIGFTPDPYFEDMPPARSMFAVAIVYGIIGALIWVLVINKIRLYKKGSFIDGGPFTEDLHKPVN